MRLALSLVLCAAPALGQQPEASQAAAEPTVVQTLRAEAEAVRPLVQSSFARDFLTATSQLPEVQPRTVFTNADHSRWYSAAQAAALPADERAALAERV